MKLSFNLFIHLTIIVIIAILNSPSTVQAKPNLAQFMEMDNPPENPPQFESSITGSRLRRNANPYATDEGDVPKDGLTENTHSGRMRRETPPGESDAPKQFQQDNEKLRAKRQMPSPPGEMPMPPM